jgi:hypothetical protein
MDDNEHTSRRNPTNDNKSALRAALDNPTSSNLEALAKAIGPKPTDIDQLMTSKDKKLANTKERPR